MLEPWTQTRRLCPWPVARVAMHVALHTGGEQVIRAPVTARLQDRGLVGPLWYPPECPSLTASSGCRDSQVPGPSV